MNVNSRGHNLDTRFEHHFQKIKHPPGIKTRWVSYSKICCSSFMEACEHHPQPMGCTPTQKPEEFGYSC